MKELIMNVNWININRGYNHLNNSQLNYFFFYQALIQFFVRLKGDYCKRKCLVRLKGSLSFGAYRNQSINEQKNL
jgi:hypothetical protein